MQPGTPVPGAGHRGEGLGGEGAAPSRALGAGGSRTRWAGARAASPLCCCSCSRGSPLSCPPPCPNTPGPPPAPQCTVVPPAWGWGGQFGAGTLSPPQQLGLSPLGRGRGAERTPQTWGEHMAPGGGWGLCAWPGWHLVPLGWGSGIRLGTRRWGATSPPRGLLLVSPGASRKVFSSSRGGLVPPGTLVPSPGTRWGHLAVGRDCALVGPWASPA